MPQTRKIAIYALTQQGLTLAKRLAGELNGTTFAPRRMAEGDVVPFDSLTRFVAESFTKYDGHIFIAAAGIAVRCIAPHLVGKDSDPAVVVLDQKGEFAVSLLSGHLGGANDLAVKCAEIVGGQAVVTTATDSAGVPSLDMLADAHGLVIGNLDRVKVVNGALLDNRIVQVHDLDNLLGLSGDARFSFVSNTNQWKTGEPGVWVSWREDCPDANALRLYPKVLILGMGCRRGVPERDITAHIHAVFDAAGLALSSIDALGSVDAKSDEAGLLEAAEKLGVEPIFYSKDQLDCVDAPNPSGAVMQRMGVGSVAEASAILLSDKGELLVEKTKTKTVTLAVARRKIC